MDALKEDLEKLAQESQFAKEFLTSKRGECKEVELIEIGVIEGLGEFSFHPNGKCGCVELDDDYMFGIRCNHLMWSEGDYEGTESFLPHKEGKAILVYGNHKGFFVMKVLYLG